MAKLTPKQQAFVDEYLIDTNATQAAIRAGYSEKTAAVIGRQNLIKVNVSRAIEQRMKEKEDARIAKQDEVLAYLTSVMRGEQTEQVLKGIGPGEQMVDDMDVSAKDRVKAAELLGKRYALWTDKQQIDAKVAVDPASAVIAAAQKRASDVAGNG